MSRGAEILQQQTKRRGEGTDKEGDQLRPLDVNRSEGRDKEKVQSGSTSYPDDKKKCECDTNQHGLWAHHVPK